MDVFLVGQNRYSVVWDDEEAVGETRLLRSEHPHDRYHEIADVTGLTQYIDVPQDQSGETYAPSRFREWYYKLEHEEGETGPSYISGDPNRHALQAARLAWRHLKRDVQSQAYLLPEPTTGERCESCWDPDRQQTVRSNCPECDGTGFQKGYATPIKLYMSFDDQKIHAEDYPNMKFAQGQHKMWTANEPIIRSGDYIVRARDMEIYEVLRVQPTTKTGLVVRQPMMSRVVEKSTIRSKVLEREGEVDERYLDRWEHAGESRAPFDGPGQEVEA